MKKILLAATSCALLATPALACPHHDDASQTPKTADKQQDPAKKDDAAAKQTNKDQKPAPSDPAAKTKDGQAKDKDKVSQN
jgi:hypothetical protein